MATKTRARDDGAGAPYRIEIPMMIDDLDLTVHAFRLYVHLKRVAQQEGSCWQSARTLAKACNMSAGQISKAKEELVQHGLIVRHIKMMRGGIGDDITLVNKWAENFAYYSTPAERKEESDHTAITLPGEAITQRSLSESDHTAITLEESDHTVIALEESDHTVIAESIKRSYSDPKNHVGDDDDDGDRARVGKNNPAPFVQQLCARRANGMPMNRKSAEKIAALVAAGKSDESTVLASLDMLITAGTDMGAIITLLNNEATIPMKGQPYEQPQSGAVERAAPAGGQRSAFRNPRASRSAGSHNPTGGSDLRDPGWRERLIAQAEAGELP
jgi:hypothetical protein